MSVTFGVTVLSTTARERSVVMPKRTAEPRMACCRQLVAAMECLRIWNRVKTNLIVVNEAVSDNHGGNHEQVNLPDDTRLDNGVNRLRMLADDSHGDILVRVDAACALDIVRFLAQLWACDLFRHLARYSQLTIFND